jgi:predicted dehydrogenase
MKRYAKARDIRVGVIGYGGAFEMGKAHLNQMKEAGMTPTAVCEPDAKRLAKAAEDFPGIETYPSTTELLKKSKANLLAIITPHNTHAKLALQCLNAGRHVVCEKPLAITTAECDAMIAASRRRGVLLSTYHNRHWDGWILHAVKTVKAGTIGDVVRVEAHMGGWGQPRDWWRSSKKISGGILYDWGVHLLEYTLQLIRSEIVEVSGYAKTGFWAPKLPWKKDSNEDEGFAVVRYKNGAWSTLCISSIDSKPKEGFFEVTGTKGTIVSQPSGWTVITHDAAGNTVTTRGANPASEGSRFYQNILDLACQSAKKGVALKAKYA